MQSQIMDILLVEDGAVPSRAMQPCFEAADTPHHLTCVPTVDEAMRRLDPDGSGAQPRPDLVIVNLDNVEPICLLVRQLKHHEATRSTPVIAVIGQGDDASLLRLYESHANCCVVPWADGRMQEIAGAIERFWLSVAQLPPGA